MKNYLLKVYHLYLLLPFLRIAKRNHYFCNNKKITRINYLIYIKTEVTVTVIKLSKTIK